MLTNYVSCQYVVTTVTLYRSALVDLSRSRSVHAVEHDPCCPDPTKLSAAECRAVHYGLCSPLLKLPPFSIPPLTPSAPSSPATPKGSQSGSKPSTPTAIITTPPLTVPKVDLEILDPVELLAVDLEGKLEALVNTFVAQDKVRLAARKKAEASGTTTTSSNLAKVSPLMPSAPQSPSLQPSKVVASVTPQTAAATSAKGDRNGKDERLAEAEGKTLPSVFTGNQHTVEATDGKRFGPGSPKIKKTNKISSKGERRDVVEKQVISGEVKKHVIQKIGEPRPTKDALKLDGKKCALNNQFKVNDDTKGKVSEIMPTKLSTDYQQVKITGASPVKIASQYRKKEANICPSPGTQQTDIPDPKLVIFHKEQLHSPPSIAKFQGSAIKVPVDLQQPAVTKPLATSILSSLKPSAEYQQTGVKAQITKFASKEKEGLQTSPVNSLERRLSPRTKPQDPLAVPSSTTSAPTPLSLETLQELLITSSTPNTITEPIPTTIFQSTRIPSISYEASSSAKGPDSKPNASPSLTAISQPQNIHPSSTNTALSAVEAVRFQHDHKSSKDSRPSSYPSTAYKDLEVNPLHQRSTSQALLPENYPHQLDTFREDITSLSDTSHRMKPNQEFIQSAVDYAKTRFQHVQQGPKVEDAKPRPKNGHLVSEAKFRWEHLPGISNQQLWPGSLPLGDQMVMDPDSNISEPLRDVLQRSGHRRTLSMEGLIDTPSPSIPHPKLTTAQKQHIRERSLSPTDRHSHVPIRPFLTKGSVAERVLLFECCPDRALERAASGTKTKPVLISTWRAGGSDVHNKTQHHYSHKDKENIEPSPRSSSLRRVHKSSTQPVHIPRFYFPEGKPQSQTDIEIHLQKVAAVFSGLNEGRATREEFGIITKACGLPLYWKLPLFLAARGDKKTSISCDAFLEYWRRVVNSCHDEASKFVRVMSRGARNCLLPEDFIPMMQDVIDSHPGLTFLKEATEFHSRYIHTVIARIYYCVNRSWSGRITVPELRKSNFLQVLSTLEEEEDINQITEYFSYEHFYVIYCKFWELDKDHDLYIDQSDLKRHNGGALSSRIIDRIFSGAVTRGPVQKEGKMSYTEFVWFLISEEDKRHPRSIEYWFRCMDRDGDGFLSMYELEFFYEEQLQRLESLGIETLPFKDCLCQMLDIIKPRIPGKISLTDLKKCRMTPIFFDSFFNLEKYLDHEQRDPFASQRQEHDGEGPEMSDWDRYAAEEYELLVAEEGASEQQDELMYEEYEPEDDELSPNFDKLTTGGVSSRTRNSVNSPDTEDDEYDYAESDADYHY